VINTRGDWKNPNKEKIRKNMHLKATTIGAALVTLAVPVVMGYSPQPNP
jgi:hypothetical protein